MKTGLILAGAAMVGVSLIAKHVLKYAQFLKSRRAGPLAPEFNHYPGSFEDRMSLFEARCILNLRPDFSQKDLNKNYKRLMQRNHPDTGGSAYVAAKINEARELLTQT